MPSKDYQDEDRCRECGGDCCKLYDDDHRASDMWFDEYCLDWFYGFIKSGALVDISGAPVGFEGEYVVGEAGIEPLHNPLWSHASHVGSDEYRASLPSWVDIDRCQFCHPLTGCMLPREHRPKVCVEFRCQDWKQEDES